LRFVNSLLNEDDDDDDDNLHVEHKFSMAASSHGH